MQGDRIEGWGRVDSLKAEHIHTVWAIIFNSFETCSGSCGVDDVNGSSPAMVDLVWVATDESSSEGTIEYEFEMQRGSMTVEGSTLAGEFSRGLQSTEAEIHLILVDNGPPQPGREAGQRTDYHVGVLDDGTRCDLGPTGNWCPFVAWATHLAPGTGDEAPLECE